MNKPIDKAFPEDPLDAALEAGFGRWPESGESGESVLEILTARSGMTARISLQDPPSGGGEPLLKPLERNGPLPGRSTGKYQLLGEIARGGIGIVLKSHDTDLGRDVALKILNEKYRQSPALLQRFIEEAQIGGQLQHPGIVPVYDLGIEDGRPFFTMKLIKGRTLAALLSERKDPQENRRRFLGIFEQVSHTMAYAHARGVIHRDLKPSNVMVGAFAEVQVVDWGLAKVLKRGGVADEKRASQPRAPESVIETIRSRGKGSHSVAGSVMGTPAYMPPEQARGDLEQMDERSDVFSLGAILCEILTGGPPYPEGMAEDQLLQASECRLQDAHRRLLDCGVDQELMGLVKDCLIPAPGARPRSAQEVAERLGRYLASLEARAQEARIVAAEERVKARAARKSQRLTLGLAASVLVTLLLGGGGYLWIEKDQEARAGRATRAIHRALGEAERFRGQAQSAPIGEITPWTQALGAAQQAQALLASADLGEDLKARVLTFLATLEREETEARARAQTHQADQKMMARLESILIPEDDDLRLKDFARDFARRDARRRTAAYAQAFQDYGIRLERLGTEEAAALIRQSAIATELAVALEDWALALRDLEDGDPDAWRRLLRIAREADPNPWRNRLREALSVKDGQLEALRQIVAQADRAALPPVTLFLLGKALANLDARDEAVSLLRSSQRIHPGDFNLTFHLGLLMERLEPPHWKEAVRFYTAARALRPRSLEALNRLGIALGEDRDLDAALDVFREAVRMQPNFPRAYTNLANTLLKKDQLDEAIEACNQAIRLQWDLASAHENLGVALARAGKPEEAIPEYRKAIGLESRSGMFHNNLARALQDTGHPEEALLSYRNAIQLQSGVAVIHNNLGRLLGKMGRLDEAIPACREAIGLEPGYASAHHALGVVLEKKGQLTEASQAYREAIRLKPDHAEAHMNLRVALEETGQLAEAVQAYREAARLQPSFALAHSILGQVLWREGCLPEALAALRRGHDLGSRTPGWSFPSKKWVEDCEQEVARLEEKLAAALRGEKQPLPAVEALSLARLCYQKGLAQRSADLFRSAFQNDARLARDAGSENLYQAARAAARAVAALKDPAGPGAAGSALRQEALEWLRAELAWRTERLDSGGPEARAGLRRTLLRRLEDPELRVLRDPAELLRLEEAERARCQALWGEVREWLRKLEAHAVEPAPPATPAGGEREGER